MDRHVLGFQHLKPPCVALSQATLSMQTGPPDFETITARLEDLVKVLRGFKARPDSLNAKFADYVFFPLSQVLKGSQTLSIRCLELCLVILEILMSAGWRSQIEAPLAGQVSILCTLLADTKPKGFRFTDTTSELQTTALSCLHALYGAVSSSRNCKTLLLSDQSRPQLGQSVETILNCIHQSPANEVQEAAISALQTLTSSVLDRDTCASFLPGIASKLTKVLTPSTAQRRSCRVLVGCLETLIILLKKTLANIKDSGTNSSVDRSTVIDAQWTQTAAKELKPAIEAILRLQTHSRDDVRHALSSLCFTLLKECRDNLASCSHAAFDVLVAMAAVEGPTASLRIQLEMLIRADRKNLEMMQNAIYDALRSLPTIMASADETAKVKKLTYAQTAYEILRDVDSQMDTINRMLAGSLRDAVVVACSDTRSHPQTSSLVAPIQSLDLAKVQSTAITTTYNWPLMQHRAQDELNRVLEHFVQTIAGPVSSNNVFLQCIGRDLQSSQSEAQIANYWLLLTAEQSRARRNTVFDDFLESDEDSSALTYNANLDDLYTLALSVLTASSDVSIDERLQALALRSLALRAQSAGEDFRYELIDALYPVLHTLATPSEQLQADSITTLNVFVAACGYPSVRELIVENVDYLTNAVALKLNAFDVSPQAPQVLLMMVRLAGPSLLPYLEDTIDSIFAALEDYHGYSLLVELLFKVLGSIADEGAEAPQLAITATETQITGSHAGHSSLERCSIDELAKLLEDRRYEAEIVVASDKPEPHPRRPWKSSQRVQSVHSDDDDGEEDQKSIDPGDEEQAGALEETEVPPPAPKTFGILLRIAKSTQHFLPSASPSLRGSLLALLRTVVPAIAQHEDTFLPLINTLWPEIVSRLDDEESNIRASALEVIAILCQYSGDFMRSRVVELWPRLLELRRTIGSLYSTPSSNAHTLNDGELSMIRGPQKASKQSMTLTTMATDTSSRLVLEALVQCFTAVFKSLDLPPHLFDEALDVLAPNLGDPEVSSALSSRNADAVWLRQLRENKSDAFQKPSIPILGEWTFASLPV